MNLTLGGANGIGASLVERCLESGANVCIGDLDNISGERLLKRCRDNFHPEEEGMPPRVIFQTTDVTNYPSVLALFDLAFKTYNRIDHVVSAAGVVEIGNWFDFELTLEEVRQVCGVRQLWLLSLSVALQSNAFYPDSNPHSPGCQPPWLHVRLPNRICIPASQPRRELRSVHSLILLCLWFQGEPIPLHLPGLQTRRHWTHAILTQLHLLSL